MNQIYPIFFFVLFFLSAPPQNYGQQYLTERLVELSIETDEVQNYFKAFNTVFILSNDYCNNMNCRASILRTNKKVMILSREDIFMRKIDKWLEFTLIQRKGDEAFVKIKLHNARGTSMRFVQKKGEWLLE